MFNIFKKSQPEPNVGQLVDVTPESFKIIQQQFQPLLAALSNKGEWITKTLCNCCELSSNSIVAAIVYVDAKKIDPRAGRRRRDITNHIASQLAPTFPVYVVNEAVHICVPTNHQVTMNKKRVATFYHVIVELDNRAVDRDQCICGSVEQQLAFVSLIKSLPAEVNTRYKFICVDKTIIDVRSSNVIANGMDEIAKVLIGPHATADDVSTTESIITAVGGMSSPRLRYFRENMLTLRHKSVILHF